MKRDSHSPLYGRLVQLPGQDPREEPQPRWPWLMPWVLAAVAVALTLLLSACATSRPPAPSAAAKLLPEIRQGLTEPSKPAADAVPPLGLRKLLSPADMSVSNPPGMPSGVPGVPLL